MAAAVDAALEVTCGSAKSVAKISRWTATALLHVERGFHRLKGYADLPKLVAALAQPSQTSTPVVVATLHATKP